MEKHPDIGDAIVLSCDDGIFAVGYAAFRRGLSSSGLQFAARPGTLSSREL
jgi:hypothetical protein